MLRQSARWSTAAEQDKAPAIALLHANYGAGWIQALRKIMSDNEVLKLTGVDPYEVERVALAVQDKAMRRIAGICPDLVPKGVLAELAAER